MVQLAKIPELGPLGLELMPGTNAEIESLESKMLGMKPCLYTQRSFFGPGVWIRELRVPGRRPENPLGNLIIGHEHVHANLNILAQGEKIVVIGDEVQRMVAPYCVLSGAGIRKVGWIIEDMVWYSVHHNPTDERDEDKLEAIFYRKSAGWTQHHAQEVRRAEERLKPLTATVERRAFK